MSSLIVIGAIGAGASIYSANQAGKRADKANAQSLAAYVANQGIATELKQRQQKLVDEPLAKRMDQLQANGLTPEGQIAQDQLVRQTGLISKSIEEQAPTAGEGVTGSRQLTNQFRQAQGLAGITLQDEANKQREKVGLMQLASQTPQWANVAVGANTQQGNFYQGQAAQETAQEQSDYAAAAQGMMNIGSAYAKYHNQKQSPDYGFEDQARRNREQQGVDL